MKPTLSLKPTPGKDLARYLDQFPDEREPLADLATLIRDCPQDLFSRGNMRGHLVASGLVLDHARENVLVIEHRLYNCWLSPGGHYEGAGSLLACARREVLEETGVSAVEPVKLPDGTSLVDINRHRVPASSAKGEGEHVHFDFLYLFQARAGVELHAQEAEVSGVKWMPLAEYLESGRRAKRAGGKLMAILQAMAQADALKAVAFAEAVDSGSPGDSATSAEVQGATPAEVTEFFDSLGTPDEGNEVDELDMAHAESPLTVADLAGLSMFR